MCIFQRPITDRRLLVWADQPELFILVCPISYLEFADVWPLSSMPRSIIARCFLFALYRTAYRWLSHGSVHVLYTYKACAVVATTRSFLPPWSVRMFSCQFTRDELNGGLTADKIGINYYHHQQRSALDALFADRFGKSANLENYVLNVTFQ